MQSLTKCTVVLDGAVSGETTGQVAKALEALGCSPTGGARSPSASTGCAGVEGV